MNKFKTCYICRKFVAGKGFHFPTDLNESRKWAFNLKCPLPVPKMRGKNGYKICSDHFEMSSFQTMKNGTKRIKKTCYPLCQPEIDPMTISDQCTIVSSDNLKINAGRSFLMTVSPVLRKIVINLN